MTVDDRMRAALNDVDFPEPRHDLAHTIQIGRRRRAARWTAAAAAGVMLIAVIGVTLRMTTPPPEPDRVATAPAPDCWLVHLVLPDGIGSAEVKGIDPTGRHTVGVTGSDRSILWTESELRLLPEDALGAEAVNGSGVVVGSNVAYAWALRGGSVERLPVPAGTHATHLSVNARGDIAGEVVRDGKAAPIVWPAGDRGTYRELATPDDAVVNALTDNGVIVGAVKNVPFRWDADGTGHPMALLPGSVGGFAVDVAGDWATGKLTWNLNEPNPTVFNFPPGGIQAVRWNLTTGEVTSLGVDAAPVAVDRDGQVLIPESPPRLIGPDKVVTPLPVDPGLRTVAVGLSDNGVVAGMLTDSPDELADPLPVRWGCQR